MWYPTKKATNKSFDSDGNAYTQRDIDRKRSEAYRDKYQTNPVFFCEGCGGRAQCSAHIVPQSRCKKLGKTELIWSHDNIFPSCNRCNDIAENVSSEAITKLRNYQRIKEFLQKHDPERASKLLL